MGSPGGITKCYCMLSRYLYPFIVRARLAASMPCLAVCLTNQLILYLNSQDEAIRHNSMIPLDIFQASSTTPLKTSWIRLPSPPTLSQVMGWGMKQLRGILSDFEGHSNVSGKVQVMNLVLVDNLKVRMNRTAFLAVLLKHIFLVKLIFYP